MIVLVMFIYRITNTINGKVYIGLDSNPIVKSVRWKSHLSSHKKPEKYTMVIHRAMAKYGKENFIYEVIDEVIDEAADADVLKEKEKQAILDHRSNDPVHGYNRTLGGEMNYWSVLSDDEKRQYGENRSRTMKALYSSEVQNRLQAGKRNISDSDKETSKKLIREAMVRIRGKDYIVTDPNGTDFPIRNLRGFCEEAGLCRDNMRSVLRGRANHHRGWKIRFANNNETTQPM